MPINWYPNAAWPQFPPNRYSFSRLSAAAETLQQEGWTLSNPTGQENNKYFRDATCDDGHPPGAKSMLVAPANDPDVPGQRFPAFICNGPHQEAVVFFPPWSLGPLSG